MSAPPAQPDVSQVEGLILITTVLSERNANEIRDSLSLAEMLPLAEHRDWLRLLLEVLPVIEPKIKLDLPKETGCC